MSNRGGKPRHQQYEEFSFFFKKENGKSVALRLMCNNILKNTAKETLKTHRKTYIITEDDSNKKYMDMERSRSPTSTAMSFVNNTLELDPLDLDVVFLNNNLINASKNLAPEVNIIDDQECAKPAAPVINLKTADKKLGYQKTPGRPLFLRQRKINPFMDKISEN